MPRNPSPASTCRSRSERARRYATMAEAAAYIDCNERTIRRMIAAGRIHGYRITPRMIRVDLDELDQVMTPIPVAEIG
jgi:excisionase family DNA binding protein